MSTYKVGGNHQHTAEIEQQLSEITGDPVQVNFTPMLAPMSRGILATASVRTQATLADLRGSLEAAYGNETFVQVLAPDQLPVTASTYGSNAVHVQVQPLLDVVTTDLALTGLRPLRTRMHKY